MQNAGRMFSVLTAACLLQKSEYECDCDQGPAEMVSCAVLLFSCHPRQQLQ